MKLIIKTKPKAREDKVEKVDESHFTVFTKIVAEKGKANAQVIKLLADYFSVPQSNVSILSGKTSRNKIVYINL